MPKNTTDVKSFLGLTGCYRKFIPQFSKIAKLLTELLKKGQKWRLDAEQIECFHFLQAALMRKPVLQYPDFTKPFVLTTDTSGFAVGAILNQGKDRQG